MKLSDLLLIRPFFRNLSYPLIKQHELTRKECVVAKNKALACDTGIFTGRSPLDKYFVQQPPSSKEIFWGSVNQPMKPDVFQQLKEKVVNHYTSKKQAKQPVYIFDGYCGASQNNQIHVRIVSEIAWQHHFVTNMFIRPNNHQISKLQASKPDFTIINACQVSNTDYQKDNLNSECFVAFNIEESLGLIGGTYYGGEMKKGIFGMMNYWLPLRNVMSMHCSANIGKKGDTALFFGLSGTGKTTLSADPKRLLIGDDEHGWDKDGIFNLEGGCYAKTIGLQKDKEPEIFAAIREDALLENVMLVGDDRQPDYDDTSKTQNGRVSYPLHHIENRQLDSKGGHPNKIIFLTCDAYGILPPVSILTTGQAMYHFLSGYTAKVAGTERGVKEPTATFSACFGEAFMPLHPSRYADVLSQKISEHQSKVYLVNTGWTGGPYGVGERIDLKSTRACIDAILDGQVEQAPVEVDPVFGFQYVVELPGVAKTMLTPRESWDNQEAYDTMRTQLAQQFIDNYQKYRQPNVTDYSEYGPTL